MALRQPGKWDKKGTILGCLVKKSSFHLFPPPEVYNPQIFARAPLKEQTSENYHFLLFNNSFFVAGVIPEPETFSASATPPCTFMTSILPLNI